MPDDRIADLQRLATANERLLHDGIRRALYMTRLQQGEAKKIVRFLDKYVIPDILEAIGSELDNLADGVLDSARLERLTRIMADVSGQLRVGMALARDELRGSLLEIAKAESAWQLNAITRAVPIELSLNSPTASVMRRVVFGDVRGVPLRDWYTMLGNTTSRKLQRQLRVGIAQGDSRRMLSRRVNNVLNTTRHHAATIARTSVSTVANGAREESYAANGDIIKGVRYVATLDHRTTERCADLDGNVYPVNEGPRPPQHHSCRSSSNPVLKSWREMGIPLKELTGQQRASMDGAVPDVVKFPQWLKGQPNSVQADNLGVGNAKLFRQGKLKIGAYKDINPRPGPLSLKQITERETSFLS